MNAKGQCNDQPTLDLGDWRPETTDRLACRSIQSAPLSARWFECEAFAVELARYLKAVAKGRAYWKPIGASEWDYGKAQSGTLASHSKRLAKGSVEAMAWLRERREALGLSNDLQAPEAPASLPVTASEATSPILAALVAASESLADDSEPIALPEAIRASFPKPRCLESVCLTQADYAALLSMTGELFAGREPCGWYEAGRNALLCHFAPALMGAAICEEALQNAVADWAQAA